MDWYGFGKQHGYKAVNALLGQTIQSLMVCTRALHDIWYIHALLLGPEYGLVEGMLPHVLSQQPHLYKAAKNDPDLPTFHRAMSGPYRSKFVEAMKKEIRELEEHKTWTVVSRSAV